MRFIFLCHASRIKPPGIADRHTPLDCAGEAAARDVGAELVGRGIKPQVYFTSWYAHAKQTAEILRVSVGVFQASVIELCTLTPTFPGKEREWLGTEKWADHAIMEWISNEAEKCDHPLWELGEAVFVMHQPRLSQLLRALTAQLEPEYGDLRQSEGICVTADSLQTFLDGKGQEDGPRFCRK